MICEVSSRVHVAVVPALSDNFMYLLFDPISKRAAAVDPVEPQKVLAQASKLGLTVECILTTHSHWDHAGGNNEFVGLVSGCEVYGGQGDGAEATTKEVWDGDVIKLGSILVRVIATPCHTPGHVCYAVEDGASPLCVFTGDTLFVAGCGNFNSGTPQMMHSAFTKLAALPTECQCFVGHEYTLANIAYAAFVEPENKVVLARYEWARDLKRRGEHSVPTTIGDERATNPFMRAVLGEPALLAHAGTADPVQALAFVRQEKSAGQWKNVARV